MAPFFVAQTAFRATVFTDTWFKQGSQILNPLSLGLSGAAMMQYNVVTLLMVFSFAQVELVLEPQMA